MNLLGTILQSLSELGKSKVDSYRHLFDGQRPIKESMESFIEKIVEDFHLDNDIVKGIISGVFAIIPQTSAQLICPIILGIIDYHCKQQTTKQMSNFVTDTIVKEVICAVDELKNANDQKLSAILNNDQKLVSDVSEMLIYLRTVEATLKSIEEELESTGLESVKDKIAEAFAQANEEQEIKSFRNGLVTFSFVPCIKNLDLRTKQTLAVERELKDAKIQGILVLGESGAGKSTMLKRIAYDLVQEGWNVYSNMVSTLDVRKVVKSLSKLDGMTLITIDEASRCGEQTLRDLILNICNTNIKILMAERTEEWVNEYGVPLIEESFLQGNRFGKYELKLEEDDVEQYLKKSRPDLSESERRQLLHKFTEDALGKPGEFVVLQCYSSSRHIANSSDEVLNQKCERIEESLSLDEKEVLHRLLSVACYGVNYPLEVLERILQHPSDSAAGWSHVKIQSTLNSLEKQGHIKIENQRVLTYHPVICEAFFRNQEEYQVQLLQEFIDNHDGNRSNNLFILGVNIANDLVAKRKLNKKKYKLAARCLEKVASTEANNAYVQYELGFIYSALGRYDIAEEKYRNAIQLRDGMYPAAYCGLGYMYKKLYKSTQKDIYWKKAEEEFLTAIRQSDNYYSSAEIGLQELRKEKD